MFPRPSDDGKILTQIATLVLSLHADLQSKQDFGQLKTSLGTNISELEKALRRFNGLIPRSPLRPHVLEQAYVMSKLCQAYAQFDRTQPWTIGPLADELDALDDAYGGVYQVQEALKEVEAARANAEDAVLPVCPRGVVEVRVRAGEQGGVTEHALLEEEVDHLELERGTAC